MSDSVTPWTEPHQASLSMKFSRQGYWMGCYFLLQDLSDAGIELGSPALQACSLPSELREVPSIRCRGRLAAVSCPCEDKLLSQGNLHFLFFTGSRGLAQRTEEIPGWDVVLFFWLSSPLSENKRDKWNGLLGLFKFWSSKIAYNLAFLNHNV